MTTASNQSNLSWNVVYCLFFPHLARVGVNS
jgi:hypothetical protein